MQNFEINSNEINKIKKISLEEKNFRFKNLELFNASGFPNKKFEDWKFSDFKNIVHNYPEIHKWFTDIQDAMKLTLPNKTLHPTTDTF